MQQIFNFVIKHKNFLLFLLLFSIAFGLNIQSHAYHKSQFFSSANSISASLYNVKANISHYLSLKDENARLVDENAKLKKTLFNKTHHVSDYIKDTTVYEKPYSVVTSKVYKNSYTKTNNYLVIAKGKRDSIQVDFGVITSKGILGIIDKTSNKYARVLSILSKLSKINATIKHSNHLGSITWNGKSPQTVQLEDISKFVNVTIGDTIVTGGQSAIFPSNIPIGVISKIKHSLADTYDIDVALFNDMTNIETVYIIKNTDKTEIKTLEGNE